MPRDEGRLRFVVCVLVVVAAGLLSLVLFAWRMRHWWELLG